MICVRMRAGRWPVIQASCIEAVLISPTQRPALQQPRHGSPAAVGSRPAGFKKSVVALNRKSNSPSQVHAEPPESRSKK